MMGQALSKAVEATSGASFACAGLVVFLAVFCGAACWAFRKARSPLYERLERMPLEADEVTRNG